MRNRSNRAAFLCYHSVAPVGPRFLTITAELFERQLKAMRDRGLLSGDLRDLGTLVAGGSLRPSVFLTFDDGFRDNYETVLPLLREYGFAAFIFVLPPLVDSGGALAWPEVAEDQKRFGDSMRSVTWEMLGEMRETAFEVGSHTLTHPHLSELSGEALREELWESRARIVGRLGSCDAIAYPFGCWTPEVAAAAADCGYSYGFSLPTRTGQRKAGALSIPRINIDYRDRERRLAMKLSPWGKTVLLSPEVVAARNILRGLRSPGGRAGDWASRPERRPS